MEYFCLIAYGFGTISRFFVECGVTFYPDFIQDSFKGWIETWFHVTDESKKFPHTGSSVFILQYLI